MYGSLKYHFSCYVLFYSPQSYMYIYIHLLSIYVLFSSLINIQNVDNFVELLNEMKKLPIY